MIFLSKKGEGWTWKKNFFGPSKFGASIKLKGYFSNGSQF